MFFPRSIGQFSVNIINAILTKTFLKDIKKEALRNDQNQYITVRKCAHYTKGKYIVPFRLPSIYLLKFWSYCTQCHLISQKIFCSFIKDN